MIHQTCLTLPRLININRHDHRISRTSLLGVVDSVCGVCRRKVDWTYGGYSCRRCPITTGYVVHSKCATRKDVWNGEEPEGVPDEGEDEEPYLVIDDNTIQHFSHKEHYLRLNNANDDQDNNNNNKHCNACSHPVYLQPFYGCVDCDFVIHQTCAALPTRIRHVLHNEKLTLVTDEARWFDWSAFYRIFSGFRYQHRDMSLDILCGSEPFVHPSHPHHPLYYISDKDEICNGCNNNKSNRVLRCIEDGCRFVLCFACATLPQVVKHRVEDHPLSLCYGAEASGKNWCDICEEETNPKPWFYTCKDQQACLHTKCVHGDTAWLMPRSTIDFLGRTFEVVLNNSVTRPFCGWCESHCLYPIYL